MDFCRWLTKKEQRPYRLPTEAQWEYVCRAGTTTEFNVGSDLFCADARFSYSYHSNLPCGVFAPANVGSYASNAFGLYDMHGNASEWCLDSWGNYGSGAVTDPFVTGSTSRVVRGGGGGNNSDACRSAVRGYRLAGDSGYSIGFRVVLATVLAP